MDTTELGSAESATPIDSGAGTIPIATEVQTPDASASTDASTTVDPAAAASATTAEGAAAAAAGATAQQVAEIEGRLNGQPYKLPGNIEIPWKRGNEQGFATLDEVRKAHMFERDYRLRTSELAEQRRAFEQNKIEVEKARRQMDVERAFVEKEQARVLEAMTSPDPAVRERHALHFQLLREDPAYAEAYQKALRADAHDAVQSFEAEMQETLTTQAILQDVQDTAKRLSEEFPGVDVQRALARYGQAVAEGKAPLKESALRAVFQDEHAYVQRSVTPLKSELDALKAEIAALKTGTKADQHNQSVRTTIAKNTASRAVAATGAAAPTSTATASANGKPMSRHERHQAFLSQP